MRALASWDFSICSAATRRSATRKRLADFIDQRAAFVAQKGIYEYSRARAGHYAKVLFSEPEFQAAADNSRWRAYPLGLAMVAELAEGLLRPADRSDRNQQIEAIAIARSGDFRPLSGTSRRWRPRLERFARGAGAPASTHRACIRRSGPRMCRSNLRTTISTSCRSTGNCAAPMPQRYATTCASRCAISTTSSLTDWTPQASRIHFALMLS